MEKEKLISFVIPCYRSELTISRVYEEIVMVISQRKEYDYEVIAVNDCSPDNVLLVMKEIALKDSKFRVVDLAKNFGKHSALMAGLKYANGDLIAILDDDYQCPVKELWRMVDAVQLEGYDCATAQYEKKQESFWKRLGAAFNTWTINWLLDPPDGIEIENFSLFRRYVCDEVLNYRNPYPYLGGLILRSTHHIKMIPMEERRRGDDKKTGFTFIKSLALFTNGLTAFSVKPLRIASIIGVLYALMGFFYGLFIVVRKITDPLVPIGYSSSMAVQLFSTGVIMLLLGLIGEYLGRIYISLNNSPQYVVRDTINL